MEKVFRIMKKIEGMIRRRILMFVALPLFLMIFVNAVSAISLGVSPATLDFEVAPGYSLEKTLTISTSSEELLDAQVSLESELKEWVSFEPRSGLKVGRNSPLRLKVKIEVPRSVEERLYEDIITITLSPSSGIGGATGSRIATGVAVKTSLLVSSNAQMDETAVKTGGFGTMLFIFAVLVFVIAVPAYIRLRRKRRK